MTDNEILALSYKNPTQFAELFNRHSGRLLAVAKRSLGSAEEAEDTVQETFVRIYKYGKKFLDQGGEFKPWSNTILKHCIIDTLRKRKVHEVSLSEEIESVIPGHSDYEINEST